MCRKLNKLKEVLEGGSVMDRISIGGDNRPDESYFSAAAQSFMRTKDGDHSYLNSSLPSIGSYDTKR